jgi:hypothetical protein
LWLAAGVFPHVHKPNCPTAGAAVEITVKGIKRDANKLFVRRNVDAELSGEGIQKSRYFEAQIEAENFLKELKDTVNGRFLARANNTRINLWNEAEGVAKRAERALVPNAHEIWKKIVYDSRVVMVRGNRLIDPKTEKVLPNIEPDVELNFKDQKESWPALIFPQGLRVGDDPEKWRMLIVEPRPGQPLFHQATVRETLRDNRGFALSKARIGEYHALPDKHADKLHKENDLNKQIWRETAASKKQAIRTGTDDENVYDQ